MPVSAFSDRVSVEKFWEKFQMEKLNQKVCRMVLSVHSKASRLACLGELGRFPIFLKGLALSIKYNWQLKYRAKSDSLVVAAYQEMNDTANDSWRARVEAIQGMFGINLHANMTEKGVSRIITSILQGKFQVFWNKAIKESKKLQFYSEIKGSFTREPYIDCVANRNQRVWLSRMRISAHNLEIEKGRYRDIPAGDRVCVFCAENTIEPQVDNEVHFVAKCPRFQFKRACFVKRLQCYTADSSNLSALDLTKTALCPTLPQTTRLANKFIRIMVKARESIEAGEPVPEYPTRNVT